MKYFWYLINFKLKFSNFLLGNHCYCIELFLERERVVGGVIPSYWLLQRVEGGLAPSGHRVECWRVTALKLEPGLLNLQIYATVHRRFIQLAQLRVRHLCLEGWSGEYQSCWKYILCSEFRVNNNSLCWTQWGNETTHSQCFHDILIPWCLVKFLPTRQSLV